MPLFSSSAVRFCRLLSVSILSQDPGNLDPGLRVFLMPCFTLPLSNLFTRSWRLFCPSALTAARFKSSSVSACNSCRRLPLSAASHVHSFVAFASARKLFFPGFQFGYFGREVSTPLKNPSDASSGFRQRSNCRVYLPLRASCMLRSIWVDNIAARFIQRIPLAYLFSFKLSLFPGPQHR